MNIIKKRDKPLGEIISQYIKEDEKVLRGLSAIKLREIYHEVVGTTISKYTENIKFDGHTGKMSIYVKSAPLKNELNLQRDKIITLLNEKIGTDLIKIILIK